MPQIQQRTSLAGAGCMLQALGVLAGGMAVLTFPTLIGPIFFGGLALWLFIYGSQKSVWLECTD